MPQDEDWGNECYAEPSQVVGRRLPGNEQTNIKQQSSKDF